MQGWAFHLGELVLVISSPDVDKELRGQIVEVVAMPTQAWLGDKQVWAYKVQHEAGVYYATQDALKKLPPPGTRPCDLNYDGNLATQTGWDRSPWKPKELLCSR